MTWPEGLIHTIKLEGFLFFALVFISLSLDAGRSTGVVLRNRFRSLRLLKYWMVMGRQTPLKDVDPTVSVEVGLVEPSICNMAPSTNQGKNPASNKSLIMFW
jgi:hypothetical protein